VASGSSPSAAATSSSSLRCFHPDTPNDVAPGGYNATEPPEGLPESPLVVTPRTTGFLA
jgi:hypothetical protein